MNYCRRLRKTMGKNRQEPHLLMLWEDEKNRQFLNGFDKHPQLDGRRLNYGKIYGGTWKVLEQFKKMEIKGLREYPKRHLLMVIDFDDELAATKGLPPEKAERAKDRRKEFEAAIPADLKERVFVIGCLWKPEKLTAALGKSPETIGRELADDCVAGTNNVWGHAMLQHNDEELARLRAKVNPFLFTA
jgi:hypothetical protein